MSDTQEKLRRAMMTGPNRWAEATINGKLVSYYEIHDETILLDLIDSAKREELKALKKESYACDCASGGAGYVDAVFVEDIDSRIAQLEQSEESEQ